MARSLRMTLERRKTAGLDDKLTPASELQKLMSEVISLREKVAQAEFEQGYYAAPLDAAKHGRQSFPSHNS
jgi:hypothetical protein